MTEEVLTGATYVKHGRSFVDDLKAFDQQAWGQVYDQHFQSLFFYALSRVGDRREAEEQAAQVLEEALRGIGRYQERGLPFRAWLFRIARNVVADHIKRRQRERGLSALDPDQGMLRVWSRLPAELAACTAAPIGGAATGRGPSLCQRPPSQGVRAGNGEVFECDQVIAEPRF
ncbi:MAG TPA: RNA polymerase sigma factor [Dehalococcoidia bacterium]|nr:RNA polymerase sigma factor [Dehalococcoidia bacterium]